MSNQWILQRKSYGLGNFIMATPALRLLSEKKREKIKVFFETAPVGDLYRNCSFITVLKKRPGGKPFFTIGAIKRNKHESESKAICRLLKMDSSKISNTYIDTVDTKLISKGNEKKIVAVFHGCLGECFRDKKDIGTEARQYLIDALTKNKIRTMLLGTEKDYKMYWSKNNLDKVENHLGKHSLIDSVGILGKCDRFISNDTGLYHVAGALMIKGLVLWKKTNHEKNRTIFDGIEHGLNGKGCLDKYIEMIDSYIKREVL